MFVSYDSVAVTGATVRLGRIAVIGSRVDRCLHPWVESRVSELRRGSRCRARMQIAITAVLMGVSASAALARASRGCGQIQTQLPRTGPVRIWTVSQVSARGVS